MVNQTDDRQLYQCPDCKCRFVQPFICTTCGAQKLYDETVRSQAATIERLRKLLTIAVDEFEITEGRIISNSNHWTVQAKKALKL